MRKHISTNTILILYYYYYSYHYGNTHVGLIDQDRNKVLLWGTFYRL